MDNIIVIECASWYQREDGLIQIVNKNGKNVILNKIETDIWNTIEYEIEEQELIDKLQSKYERSQIKDILEKFYLADLVSIHKTDEDLEILFG